MFSRAVKVKCGDGIERSVILPLACHAGDWPEHCFIAGLMTSTQCSTPCNQCEVPNDCLFEDGEWQLRSKERTQWFREEVALLRRSKKRGEATALLTAQSMRDQGRVFSADHPFFDEHLCCPPDLMHQSDQGFFKAILIWFVALIGEVYRGAVANKVCQAFDRCGCVCMWSGMPR